jgi:hypothetical protein
MQNVSIYTMSDSETAEISMSQILNTASTIDVLLSPTQPPPQPSFRIAGFGKGYVLHVAPDFDAPFELEE